MDCREGDMEMEQLVKQMIEKQDVIHAVNEIFITMDRFDWDGFLKCFADEVEDDYTSLFKGGPNRVKHADVLERWKYLKKFSALYHSLSNHRVTVCGDEADCYSYVYSLHVFTGNGKNDIWKVIGFYDHHLVRTGEGWKMDKMKFTAVSVTGVEVLKSLGVYDKLQDKWKA